MRGRLLVGGMKPAGLWLNGRALAPEAARRRSLSKRNQPHRIRYDGPGTGYVAVVDAAAALRLRRLYGGSPRNAWKPAPGLLAVRCSPRRGRSGRLVPPADRARNPVDDRHGPGPGGVLGGRKAVSGRGTRRRARPFHLPEPGQGESIAALRVGQERGAYGGAALPEPIVFECGEGRVRPGDWSQIESLESYSGGLAYAKTFAMTRIKQKAAFGSTSATSCPRRRSASTESRPGSASRRPGARMSPASPNQGRPRRGPRLQHAGQSLHDHAPVRGRTTSGMIGQQYDESSNDRATSREKARASGSRSIPTRRTPSPAARIASACPPRPSVAST